MKSTIGLIIIMFVAITATSQNNKVMTANNYAKPQYNELAKAKEAIDIAIVNDKTKNSAFAWKVCGDVYFALAITDDERFKNLCENPQRVAYDAYKRALELDLENKYKAEIESSLKKLNYFESTNNQTVKNQKDKVQNLTEGNSNESDNSKSNIENDVDINIPINSNINSKTFVVIIGNETYDSEIAVKYAINDAQTFYKYVTKTFGVPNEQVHLLTNATYGKILRELQWISSIAQAFTGEANIIFYYAGHGMPDEKTKESYLLPVDGDASQPITAISLDKIYSTLNEYPTKQVTVFLDACFSGAARNGMLASGRGVKIMPKETTPQGNMVVFSAVTGDQTAHPYESKAHGLFSYYLMKKLQETSGDISYGKLGEYLIKEVNRKSAINGNSQTPQVNVSINLGDTWKVWGFK